MAIKCASKSPSVFISFTSGYGLRISVPTITLEGDANGAPHPQPEAYAKQFTGKYAFRLITGGIGHNLPEEAPQAFTQAVIDADHL